MHARVHQAAATAELGPVAPAGLEVRHAVPGVGAEALQDHGLRPADGAGGDQLAEAPVLLEGGVVVDHLAAHAGLSTGGDDRVGVGQGGGQRLLADQVTARGGDVERVVAVQAGRGRQQNRVEVLALEHRPVVAVDGRLAARGQGRGGDPAAALGEVGDGDGLDLRAVAQRGQVPRLDDLAAADDPQPGHGTATLAKSSRSATRLSTAPLRSCEAK
jgi:hypothetical protein